ncbi:hypothetical protein GCM10009864_81420 [Streptomyces lunalinharesii]|uniref:Uncharacterized protein n=1 Tax=Streptomyces lunalinharesii TaxID=333384 RepID=A0ABN3T8W6_9ACTN
MPLVPPVIKAVGAGMMRSFAYFWVGVSSSVRGRRAVPRHRPFLAAYGDLTVTANQDVTASLAVAGILVA